ncbi:winged helix-turn-helix domain-containing protein [Kribbella sp. CA-293567]|uniref:winged helix-turn-helix domain-containing protein n=1 Tax=Kribbella sp. CA-293567 TaxID=3002436 RepID=UPI0022DE433D|nr:winged helix-turn-helix domain-containing protein [Kribbella sp. CA-293567]WBQ07493.1 winged helix-turn-helix domain-containing protein [Kribbella sp. CA-293567]
MERLPDSSLIIGVATSAAERVQLVQVLGSADALLLVSSAEQARAFLDQTTMVDAAPVVLTPAVLPTATGAATMAAQIEAALPTSGRATPNHPAQLAVAAADTATVGGLRLDEDRRVVSWKDREMRLTRLEHDFLVCLATEPGKVWTYQRLHHAVWGNEHLGHGSHIHSVVKRLRQKLASLEATVTIHAVRGVGFHLLPAA